MEWALFYKKEVMMWRRSGFGGTGPDLPTREGWYGSPVNEACRVDGPGSPAS